jgi:hypothetical protein
VATPSRRRYGYELSKFEKNYLFVTLQKINVPITGYELSEKSVKAFSSLMSIKGHSLGKQARRSATIIRHGETASIFSVVKVDNTSFRVQYDTGDRQPEWTVLNYRSPARETYLWSGVIGSALRWVSDISDILHDTGTSDLWAGLKSGKSTFGSQKNVENTPLTAAEQAEISAWGHKVIDHVKAVPQLSPATVSEIEGRIEHLEKASERVGRKDWVMMFNGAITSLILSDLLPARTVEQIFFMAVHGFGHLFGLGVPPHLVAYAKLSLKK